MALDFICDRHLPAQARRRSGRGCMSHHAGRAAEDAVARHYEARGHVITARRWRGLSGEIDLILLGPEGVIFVEVKQAPTHDLAAERLGRAQIGRIHDAAGEYIERILEQPFIERQFHLALVDRIGRIRIIEDAFFLM